jgi:selenocysteine lyase/cysteine desulfurase
MLIPKSDFIGLDQITHLCAGGETPMLKTHQEAVARFFADKALGEAGRERFEATYRRCKEKVAHLFGVQPEEIAFLASSSEGINLLAHALTWQPGDNVVVCDVEFPSDVLPWARLKQQGVEVRVISQHNWAINLEELAAKIDRRTRVVDVSYVSYFTGQRLPLETLSKLVRASNALLVVDATHAAGAVPVQAGYADILVSSCYKWLLGVHGLGIFYWNRERLPDLEPPFVGWHTGLSIPDWQEPTAYSPRPDADKFVPGNPSFISLYILENALDRILQIGIPTIEHHVLRLSGQVWQGVHELGWELMTPYPPEQRAGNVCFMVEDVQTITTELAQQGILVWGSYAGVGGRIRVSTHLYNDKADVERFLSALQSVSSENRK